MITFAREPLTDALWDEAAPLLAAHYAEVAQFHDIPLDPDRAAYAQADRGGVLRAFTARDEAGALVGYALFFVRTNYHYRTSVQAVQDVLYVDPDARRALTGYRFVEWCDGALRAEGVQVTYQHVKAARDFGPMLLRQGYLVADTIYAKRLDQ